jgi:hypothetical protein
MARAAGSTKEEAALACDRAAKQRASRQEIGLNYESIEAAEEAAKKAKRQRRQKLYKSARGSRTHRAPEQSNANRDEGAPMVGPWFG